MNEEELEGILTEEANRYFLTTKDGTKYAVYAISPWESVPPDFDTAKFAKYVDQTVIVTGHIKDTEIWGSVVYCQDKSDIKAPNIDDLLASNKKKK